MKTYKERAAAVQKKLHSRQARRRTLAITASAMCLCIVAGIMFYPMDNTSEKIHKYADNDYSKVIAAIKNADFQNGGLMYDEILREEERDFINAPSASVEGSVNTGSTSNNSSVEITDHQVAGVLEADLIKRSETHIFYLNGSTLEIYPIAGIDTKLLGKWKLNLSSDVYYNSAEMYLSADASRLIVVISGYGDVFEEGKKTAFVKAVSLDVSDPSNVKEDKDIYVTGSLLSSRMVGDQIMLMAQYGMDPQVDFDNQATFLPRVGTQENMMPVPAGSIVVPEELSNRFYTVVVLLDSSKMSVIDSGAFMSYSSELYVSADRIYATRAYTEKEEVSSTEYISKSMTEISCMSYSKNGLSDQGTFSVEGTVKNQYSMDEYGGIFRIVTATSERQMTEHENGSVSTSANAKRNANLTCFLVGTWEQVAQVKNFAPEGETVESVRFDGNYAYVCTAVVITLTDPVFFIDMTDLNNITVKDTGTIEGYSNSLIQLNDGFLMGIGYNAQRNLKVEIYKETDNGVVSVCEYIKVDRFAIDYKAYYIDRENNLFGIPTGSGYILLQFDGYQLNLLAQTATTQPYSINELDDFRGVVIDKCLYVFGLDYFKVQEIGKM